MQINYTLIWWLHFILKLYEKRACHKVFKQFHYEAKLCILCIVIGFRNRPKSDLSRNPQFCYFSLIFFAVLDSTNKYQNIVPLKIAPKIGEIQNIFLESTNNQLDICIVKLSFCGFCKCKRNPQRVSGIRKL